MTKYVESIESAVVAAETIVICGEPNLLFEVSYDDKYIKFNNDEDEVGEMSFDEIIEGLNKGEVSLRQDEVIKIVEDPIQVVCTQDELAQALKESIGYLSGEELMSVASNILGARAKLKNNGNVDLTICKADKKLFA
ncbi:hypothetical protein [Vibrio crassostreae]|uniref:hypothetical protein n=1 Tax=Vibrio crassostreae TaxID=246167 RepID=UPI001B314E28|nr:hypothetical protein [Vibrio crassostreae]